MTLNPDHLDDALADLTATPAATTDLWRKALDQAGSPPARRGGWRAVFSRPIPQHALAACLVVLVGLLMVGVFMPSLGRARRSAPTAAQVAASEMSVAADRRARSSDSYRAASAAPLVAGVEVRPLGSGLVNIDTPAPADRSVIRKATIELLTPDVRAAFAKAAHLISDAQSEYVQDSSITGEGLTTQAQLTLRIAVPRLSSVLDELRQLGTVRSETSGGEDVTSQAVDLDARIRNEQRVEVELLQLMDKRADAPLKDILELRQSLSDVRQTIERLTGERQRLSRLVDLAAVLVLIRSPADPKPAASSAPLADYFRHAVSTSWRSSLEFLTDTVANLLALLVGGVVWWILAAIIIIAIFRHRRAALARGV